VKVIGNNRKSKKQILVWGAGGHAKVVADILRLNGFHIIGFIDDHDPARSGEIFCGAKISARTDDFIKAGARDIIIAIGDNRAREQKAKLAKARGFKLASVVHPRSAVASDVQLGVGTVVMAGAVINSGSIIGENSIINTSASIDHDCILAENVHISPGARIAGGVQIGRGTWIGIGATIIDKVSLGENIIVGAGAVVIRNIASGAVVVGVPARKIKSSGKSH
jgi:sugar O-acyltransferase (sialic acid O-acetyltransferase NeuD family)